MTLSIEKKPLSPIQQRLNLARQRQAESQISKRPYSPTTQLSFAQERQWLVEQLAPGDPANNRPTALRLIGNLNHELLQQTIAGLVQRHAPLRTTFSAQDETITVHISAETAVPLTIHNLQTLPETEREDTARQQLTAVARQPFDLENGAPLRADLWQLTPTDHLLLLNVHHINFDGWSEGILRDELTTSYHALAHGRQPNLPPLPIAYSDFAHWQRRQAANNAWEADLAYWRQQLSGDIPLVHLPADLRETAVSPTGAEQSIQLPLDLVEKLQIIGQQHGATLFMTLLAAYKLLLQAISAEEDITVGVPVAGRNRVELEGLIGLFVNVVVLRANVTGSATFTQLLEQIRQTTLTGLSHQSLPFAQLIEDLQPERNLERPPFYQTVFQLRNYRASQNAAAENELQVEPFSYSMNASAVDLSVDAVLKSDSLQVRARYRADRFSSQRISDFLEQYRQLLAQIAENPELLIAEFTVDSTLFSAPALPTKKAAKPTNGRSQPFVPPQTPLQKALAAVWTDLLPVPRVGLHHNFFALGGHSLLGTRLLARIRQQFQVELSLSALFESPTVAELAEAMAKTLPEGQETMPTSPAVADTIPVEAETDQQLSPVQERLWFLEQFEPGKSTLQLPLVVRLAGELNMPALQQALDALVARHAPLRTTFSLLDGQPNQQIMDEMAVPLTTRPLAEADDEETAVSQQIQQIINEPFDLAKGPLLRAVLLQKDEGEAIFVLTMHHIISDGWSIRILSREMSELYNAFVEKRPSPLPPLPIQYNDFATWQRQQLESERVKKQLAYWQNQLADAPPFLELPTDFPRPAVRTTRADELTQTLPAALVNSLRQLSQETESTLFMVMLATFKLLLYRFSGQEELVVGTPIAGRTRTEVESLIGFFINTLALRTQLSGEMTFRNLVQQVRQITIDAYTNQDLPFERLLETLKLERDLSRTPLFQVFFNMLNMEAQSLALDGLACERLPWFSKEANFDLTLYLTEQAEGQLQLRLVYNTDLFSTERMHIFMAQYRLLMEQISANANLPIQQYSLLTPETTPRLPDPTQQLSNKWEGAIQARVTQQTAVSPNQIALIDEQDSWTYAELESRSNQLAHHLQAQGIGTDDVVAIYAHRSASLVWAILGVFKAGAAYTILDPAYPPDRLLSYLQVAQPKGIIQLAAAGELPEEVRTALVDISCQVSLPRLETAVSQNFLAQYPTTPPNVSVSADSLALVTFTSGSTGLPKGVMGRHGPLSHFLPWQTDKFGLNQADRFSMLSGLSHDPLQRDIFTALWVGGTLCIPSQDTVGAPGGLAAWMAEQAITFSHMTPPMAQLLTETAVNQIPSLRYTFFVGDKLTQEDVRRLQQIAPKVTSINSYGSTETQRAVTFQLIPPNEKRPWHKAVYPLGTGMAGTQILVLNQNQQLAGIGEAGEIYMRSHHLARGYLGDEAKTQARFLPNPFTNISGDRLYRTGDLGRYLPDGRVVFAGRADRQVKIRGFRIEPGEVESALLGHTAVRDAVVTIIEMPQIGPALAAYVVVENVDIAELRAYLQDQLPDFMVPATFVTIDKVPLTPNGKINYKALPTPDWQNAYGAQTFTPPRTETETKLATIWEEFLGVTPISVFDNFFTLGGHSLLAMRMFAKIEKRLGLQLPISLLFQHPTIAQLAKTVEQFQQKPTQATTALAPIKPTGSRPPFFCVHGGAGHVFHYQKLASYLDKEQPFYGIQPPDWTKRRVEVPNVTELAANYVQEIRKLQPNGPYHLGGFCFGGTIVFEMARQLQASGEEVALLALIEPASAAKRGIVPQNQNGHEPRHTLQQFSDPSEEKPSSVWGKAKRFGYGIFFYARRGLSKGFTKLKRAAFAVYLATGAPVPRQLRDFYLIQFVTRFSRKAYKPATPFEGNIHLTVVDRGELVEPTLGWRQHTTGEISLCQVNTNHVGVLKEPHVQIVAKELQQQLDEAQAQLD